MNLILVVLGGFLFPPIWFMGAGSYISKSHAEERRKQAQARRRAMAPHRRGAAAGKRTERNMAAYWHRRYQAERNARVNSDKTTKSSQAARVKETSAHNQARKKMAALFTRIVKIANETSTRMPARLDRIRALANAGRGMK